MGSQAQAKPPGPTPSHFLKNREYHCRSLHISFGVKGKVLKWIMQQKQQQQNPEELSCTYYKFIKKKLHLSF